MSIKSNTRWVLASQIFRVLTQFIGMIYLSRLLQPKAYGLMAMASVITSFAYTFKDLGTASAIIQAKEVNNSTASTIHWTNVGLCTLLSVFILISAPIMAYFFKEPELLRILTILAAIFPILSFSTVHQALLERGLRYAFVAKAEIASAALALLLAIILAKSGYGVYSLVWQWVVAAVVTSMIINISSDFKPKYQWRKSELAGISRYSANMSLNSLLYYSTTNFDSMILGKLAGAAALGAYSIAYRIMLFPVQNISWVVTRAIFPVLSKFQADKEKMQEVYLDCIGLIFYISFPLMSVLWLLRTELVELVFGSKWIAAVPIIAWLAPVGVLQTVSGITSTIFMACNRSDLLPKLGFITIISQSIAFSVGAYVNGAEGLAIAYFITSIPLAILRFIVVGKVLDLKLSLQLNQFKMASVLTLTTIILMKLIAVGVTNYGYGSSIIILVSGVMGLFFFALASLKLEITYVTKILSFFKR